MKKLFARLIINTVSRESINNQRIKELCSKSCPSLQVKPTEDRQKYAKGEEHIVECKLGKVFILQPYAGSTSIY